MKLTKKKYVECICYDIPAITCRYHKRIYTEIILLWSLFWVLLGIIILR